MYDICATDMEFERCSKDKEQISLIVPYTVIHFVLAGEGTVNGQKVSENTVFISYKDTHMDYYPSRENPWSYVYVRLLGRDIKKAFLDYDFKEGITILPFEKKKELFHILSLYNSLCDYDNQQAARTIANAVLLLFEKESAVSETVSIQNQNAEKIKRFIDENYHKKITVSRIADEFFFSRQYLCKIFKENTGFSVYKYISYKRIVLAKELYSKGMSLSEASRCAGFNDYSAFYRAYTKIMGETPQKSLS